MTKLKNSLTSTSLLYLQVDGLEGISYASITMLPGHLKRQPSTNNIKRISTNDRSHSYRRSVNTEQQTQHHPVLVDLKTTCVANITHLPWTLPLADEHAQKCQALY